MSEVELVFALAALEIAGAARGDRIEHASVASPDLVRRIASLGLAVCVQPHFIEERGDRYLLDVEARHVADLYRLRSFADTGVSLAGGSDAPFGGADPWAAMRAAVSRITRAGVTMDAGEALAPEEALGLFLAGSILALGVSLFALALFTIPAYRFMRWLTGPKRIDEETVFGSVSVGPTMRRQIDVKIVE